MLWEVAAVLKLWARGRGQGQAGQGLGVASGQSALPWRTMAASRALQAAATSPPSPRMLPRMGRLTVYQARPQRQRPHLQRVGAVGRGLQATGTLVVYPGSQEGDREMLLV